MMTQKRKATEALFRQKIEEGVTAMRNLGCQENLINDCLLFARFAIRTLRELEEAERKALSARFVHPDDCDCVRCDYRPGVERSVEEVAATEGEP